MSATEDEPDWLDDHGYPTEAAIERIAEWEFRTRDQLDELWAFVRSLWYYPNRFVEQSDGDRIWQVSTGGWSGNEDVVSAMRSNFLLWSLTWVQSRRGGHHIFDLNVLEPTP